MPIMCTGTYSPSAYTTYRHLNKSPLHHEYSALPPQTVFAFAGKLTKAFIAVLSSKLCTN